MIKLRNRRTRIKNWLTLQTHDHLLRLAAANFTQERTRQIEAQLKFFCTMRIAVAFKKSMRARASTHEQRRHIEIRHCLSTHVSIQNRFVHRRARGVVVHLLSELGSIYEFTQKILGFKDKMVSI